MAERPEDSSAILRQPAQVGAARRLPGRPVTMAEPTSELDRLAQLRLAFADELAALEAEARQQGLQAGRAEAAAEAAKRLEKAQDEQRGRLLEQELEQRRVAEEQFRALAGLLHKLEEEQGRIIEGMAPVVERLTLATLAKLLGHKQVLATLVADLAAHAIEEYRLEGVLKVRISAEDHARLSMDEAIGPSLTRFQVDRRLAPGDCWIDYGQGSLDASLDTQLAVLRAHLLVSPGNGGADVGEA